MFKSYSGRGSALSLVQQRQIVAKVDLLMGLVNELEAHLAASRASVANLLQPLVFDLTACG